MKLSGHDPRVGPVAGIHGPYGWSVYVQRGRRTYYITHLGTRTVELGQRVRRGQALGTVGDYARWGGSNHVHVGLHVGL